MTAQIISFPSTRRVEPTPAEERHRFDFWFPLLDSMPPTQRKKVIVDAYSCGVIDERDCEILMSSWSDMVGA